MVKTFKVTYQVVQTVKLKTDRWFFKILLHEEGPVLHRVHLQDLVWSITEHILSKVAYPVCFFKLDLFLNQDRPVHQVLQSRALIIPIPQSMLTSTYVL